MNRWIWLGLFLVTLGAAALLYTNRKPTETKSPAAVGGPEDFVPAPENPNNPTPIPQTPLGAMPPTIAPDINNNLQNVAPTPSPPNEDPAFQNLPPNFPPNPTDSFDPSTINPAPPFPDNPPPDDDFIPPPPPPEPED